MFNIIYNYHTMDESVTSTLKSSETEDWLDYHITRPLSYLWAKLFARLGVHPNAVTIMSMVIGAASALFFFHGSFHYEGSTGVVYNLIGIVLLLWAAVFDCTDGQLARMTGKKSRLGRILDGAAGYAWYIPIYAALIYRFYLHHDIEFGWLGIENTETNSLIATAVVFVLAFISGVVCLADQQRMADYYIQIHLFFLKGEKGSELDNSAAQVELYNQMTSGRFIQKLYVNYTRQQERRTPQFQNLMAKLRARYGDTENFPQEVRDEIHANSLKLMKYVFMLVFNFRSAYLFLFCLLDVPVMAFLFEIVIMSIIECFVVRRHESFCKRIAQTID